MNKLTPGKLVTLVFIGMTALVGMYAFKTVTAGPDIELPPRTRTRAVPLARVALEPGHIVQAADLTRGDVPWDVIVGDVLLAESIIVGRHVAEPIPAGAMLRSRSLLRAPDAPPTFD